MTVLLARSGRTILRRWASKDASIAAGRAVQFLRVATFSFSNRLPSQSPISHSNDSSVFLGRRSFATRPGRPKGHTGRVAASKKTATPKAPKAAKTPKTTAAKTLKKASEPKTVKAKPKKKAAKPNPKKRVAKPLSETAKANLEKKKQLAKVRGLKATALTPPKRLPDNAWTVYFTEQQSASKTFGANKSLSDDYKNFTPEQKEHYNHIANQNKASNNAAYAKWIESHTPEQVYLANNARKQLKKQLAHAGKYTPLKDDRSVKQPRTAYIYFMLERLASGDLKNMKVSEIGSLVGSEWKALTDAEKKKYQDLQVADRQRYITEYKTVFGKDPALVTKPAKAR